MALLKDGMYIRTENFGGDKRQLVCVLRYYKDDTAREVVKEEGVIFIPQAESRWDKQAYEYIKNLDKFRGKVKDV